MTSTAGSPGSPAGRIGTHEVCRHRNQCHQADRLGKPIRVCTEPRRINPSKKMSSAKKWADARGQVRRRWPDRGHRYGAGLASCKWPTSLPTTSTLSAISVRPTSWLPATLLWLRLAHAWASDLRPVVVAWLVHGQRSFFSIISRLSYILTCTESVSSTGLT